MKIIMITNHACMRCHKEAICLMHRSHKVHLITNKLTQYSDLYESIMVYQDIHQMRNAIKMHADANIFHCHNEPSWFVTVVKELFPDAKVVLDVHDSLLLRREHDEVEKANDPEIFRISADERNNIQLADGLVYVCKPMQEIVEEEFSPGKPNIVLPSALPRQFYRIDFVRWEQALVYEGRIDNDRELEKQWGFFKYSNYIEFAKKCRKHNIPFHIYTPRKNEEVRSDYSPHCVLHEPLAYDKFIKEMGRHDWGLVGNCFPTPEWKYALPNKLFEYMAACLPVICFNADESWNFIKDYGMGIKVDSFEEIADRWAEHRVCRQNVIKHRHKFCLENYIGSLEELYYKL